MANKSKLALEYYDKFLLEEENGNFEQSRIYLERSLTLGEPMAHHLVAYEEFGNKMPRASWALRHYRTAAKKGFAPSAWNLAKYYESTHKPKLYHKWMECAAHMGDPEAAKELAYFLKFGLRRKN